MNQIATTIEQSKKLIELGIDVNTADMNYCNSSYKGKNYVGEWKLSLQSPQEAKSILDMSVTNWNTYWEIIPAWSLSELIELMPSATLDSSNDHFYRLRCAEKFSEWHNNPIDTAFEMVCYLLENKLIK